MGGLASGRWKDRARKTVESYLMIDVDQLSKKGCLRPGWSGTWRLIVGNECFLINVVAEAERVRLQQQAEAERWATTAIRSDELLLTDVSLNHGYSGWTLKGTVTNNSKVALGSISFLITIKDCPTNKQCKIIGQENTATRTQSHLAGLFDDIPSGDGSPPSCSSPCEHWVLDVLVPPGQVRLFETNEMEFRNMPPSSSPQWTYQITEITAVR